MPSAHIPPPEIFWLGLQDYSDTFAAMAEFTRSRGSEDADQIWLLEHPRVYTQGRQGRAEHLLAPGDIPVIQSDRGGQVTYHGPGQLVVYPLVNIDRLDLNIRQLVTALETAMIGCLNEYTITATSRTDAPGVYVDDMKIGSLGLRVTQGCAYHGLSLNVAMDLAPFHRINPCGFQGLQMTQVSDLVKPTSVIEVATRLLPLLLAELGLPVPASLPDWNQPEHLETTSK